MPRIAGDRGTRRLQCPTRASSPSRRRCGRRERGTDAELGSVEQSTSASPLAFATVEGVPVCGMTWSFAGPRRNAGLRSVRRLAVGLLPCQRPTDDIGRPEIAEGRERCPHARIATHAPDARCSNHLAPRPSTRPSLGPRTRADQSPLVNSCGATRPEVALSSRYRGRATLAKVRRNRTRGFREWIPHGSPRLTAPAREAREASEKEGRHGARPREESRELEVRARTSYAVAEVDRRRLVSKKLVKRAPKRAAGASERGPRSPQPKAVTRRGCAEIRNGESPTRSASDITERYREKA